MARKPDFWLKARNKTTNEKRKIGAAWMNSDRSISIDIDAFTVLQLYVQWSESHPDLDVTLFPINRDGMRVKDDD